MKILIINQFFSLVGGAELIAYNTYKMLKIAGHDVYFWATNYKPYIEENYRYTNFFTSYNGGLKNFIKNPIYYFYNKKAQMDLRNFIKFVTFYR